MRTQNLEDLLAQPGVKVVLRQQRGMSRRAAPVPIAVGLALLAASYFLGHVPVELQQRGARTVGFVDVEATTTSANTKSYTVWVDYRTADGSSVRFRATQGSRRPGDDGARVWVRYLPDDPQTARIDRGPGSWLPALVVMVSIGLLLAISGLRAIFARDSERVN